MDIELKINTCIDSIGDSVKKLLLMLSAKSNLASEFLCVLANVLKDPEGKIDLKAGFSILHDVIEEQEQLVGVIDELECTLACLRAIDNALEWDPPYRPERD